MPSTNHPSITGTTLHRPGRCILSPPRRDRGTFQLGNVHSRMPASDNPPPLPVPCIDQYSRGVASSDSFPSVNGYILPTPTPQTRISTLSLAFRTTLAAANVLPPLSQLLKLPLALMSGIHSCIPRFYSSRFAFSKICPHSAGERGDIGHVGPQWARQAQAVNAHYVTIATGSSSALSIVVTVLQLQATTSNAYVTTLIVSAIIFIIHAISCSVMYINYRPVLSEPGIALIWSQDKDDTVLLWQLLALPLQFVLLTAAFTCAAMFVLAWGHIANAGHALGDTTPIGPVTTLPESGASSAPPPSTVVPGPDLADRLSIPLRQALVILVIIYGTWKIVSARKKLAAMARNDKCPAPEREALLASSVAGGEENFTQE